MTKLLCAVLVIATAYIGVVSTFSNLPIISPRFQNALSRNSRQLQMGHEYSKAKSDVFAITNVKDQEFLYACKYIADAGPDEEGMARPWLAKRMLSTSAMDVGQNDIEDLQCQWALEQLPGEEEEVAVLIRNVKNGEYLYSTDHSAQSSVNEAGVRNPRLLRRMVSTSPFVKGSRHARWVLTPPQGSKASRQPLRFHVKNAATGEGLYACRHYARSHADETGRPDTSVHARMVSSEPGVQEGYFKDADLWDFIPTTSLASKASGESAQNLLAESARKKSAAARNVSDGGPVLGGLMLAALWYFAKVIDDVVSD